MTRGETPMEVRDEDILGPADTEAGETGSPFEAPEDGTEVPESGTETPASEREMKKFSKKMEDLRARMQGNAAEAHVMIPTGETPEHQRMAALASEARELAAQAEEEARNGAMKALEAMDHDDPGRLDAVAETLIHWPDIAGELGDLGFSEAAQTIIALRLVADRPDKFLESFYSNDFGLDGEERLAIAEEMKREFPELLDRAVQALRLPTEAVRELVADVDPDVKREVFESLSIPETGEGLTQKEMSDFEVAEMKDERLQKFEETSRRLSLEILRTHPDRVEKERARQEIERGLYGGIISARDFGKTNAAPMVVSMEGRSFPALYKAEKREITNEKKTKKEIGRWTRPGIEPGTSPSREWLAHQVDRVFQLDVVPVTVMRSGPDGRGSVQDWEVSETMRGTRWLMESRGNAKLKEQLARIAFLDVLTENSDRHSSNFVRTPDDRVIAIDNGLMMPKPESSLDAVRSQPLWAVEGEGIPQELRDSSEAFQGNPALQEGLRQAFEVALGKDAGRAWDAFQVRLEQLTSEGFPTEDTLAEEGNFWVTYEQHQEMKSYQRGD